MILTRGDVNLLGVDWTTNQADKDIVSITFPTDNDRTRGIGTLWRSKLLWNGIGDNTFLVRKEHLRMLKDRHIKYAKNL
jgi:hypothetical protein